MRSEQIADMINRLHLRKDGKPQIEKMNLITYEPVHHGHIVLSERVGSAFSDGKKLK